jgi:hypothetical protein
MNETMVPKVCGPSVQYAKILSNRNELALSGYSVDPSYTNDMISQSPEIYTLSKLVC